MVRLFHVVLMCLMSVVPLGLSSNIGSQPQLKTWGYLPLSLRDILANNHPPFGFAQTSYRPRPSF